MLAVPGWRSFTLLYLLSKDDTRTDGVRRSKQYKGSVSQRLLRPQFSLLQLKVVFAFSLASSLAKAHARGSLLLPSPRYEKFAHIKIAYALLNSS